MKQLLPGTVKVQFVSGDHANFLSRLNRAGIPLFHLAEVDELTAQCQIRRVDYRKLVEIAARTGTEVTVLKEFGVHQLIKRIFKRWILATGVLMLFLLTVYIPSRIFFIQVKGNAALPAEKIVEAAELCGIYFGASRKDVRSEKVKNALISVLPELQWVGVNTSGCVAEISVREKTLPAEENQAHGVTNIVAVTDGIIRELTVTQGSALCEVGQAVKKDQVIISGYTDCGLLVIGTQAQGEVYGETRRNQTSVTPLLYSSRQDSTDKNINYSLQIGKKLIKFYNGSGISDTSCVKMYKKEYLTLPGGFILPIALVTETIEDYTLTTECAEEPHIFDWLSQDAKSYLLTQTIAGKLISSDELRKLENGICNIQSTYICYEMMGKTQYEESILKNGSNG